MVFGILNLTRDTILGPLGLIQYTGNFLFEFIDIIIMAFAIGYIFSGFIKMPVKDPLLYHQSAWQRLKIAAIVAGPAVVVHELAHKIVAIAFGAQAVLYAPYGFYLLVIILKAIGFPFLFFVGGFVVHSPLPALPSAIVAVVGPLSNFLMWGGAKIAARRVDKKWLPYLVPFAQINLFLGIFNMIPLPGFDGYAFFGNIFRFLF